MMNIAIIIFAIILFNVVVFVHEFGHFFMAKTFNVKVNEFAIGMGPQIFKFKKGETVYSLRIFPIGGFCEMEGEDKDSDDDRAFDKCESWKRILIIVAGAFMNIVLGIVMTFILSIQQPKFASTVISGFRENAVSGNHGLEVGDRIDYVNGYRTRTYKDILFAVTTSKYNEFNIGIERDGQNVYLDDVQFVVGQSEKGASVISTDFYVEPIEKNFITTIRQTFLDTFSTIKMVWASLAGMLTGKFSFREMSGPVGIASAIGEATQEGLKVNFIYAINNIITIMAMITVNLGVVNLLPLPALDGGRLVFLIFEFIFGKKLDPKYEGWVHAVGFFILILLMLFMTYSDILKLIPR